MRKFIKGGKLSTSKVRSKSKLEGTKAKAQHFFVPPSKAFSKKWLLSFKIIKRKEKKNKRSQYHKKKVTLNKKYVFVN